LEVLPGSDSSRPAGVDGGTPSTLEPKPVPLADPDQFDVAFTPTIQKLQGEWTPLELVTSGAPLQASYLPFGSRTHSGVETKVVFGGQTMLHAKVRFNEAAIPVEVDYLSLMGKGKGSISLGLFRWDGDVAVLHCATRIAKTFGLSCNSGSGRTRSRWKRKS
jgi:hypothetical protein